jgi:DNA-binding response OmpR family regulator
MVREEPIGRIIEETLIFEGYDVVATTRADEALRIARESSEGLIIFMYVRDPFWPGNEGLKVFSTARPPNDGHIVILLVAAPENLARAAELHADGFICMPFVMDDLIKMTARAQRLFRTRRHGYQAH